MAMAVPVAVSAFCIVARVKFSSVKELREKKVVFFDEQTHGLARYRTRIMKKKKWAT